MVYTYLAEKYYNGKWVFDKRVIGVINISNKNLPVAIDRNLR